MTYSNMDISSAMTVKLADVLNELPKMPTFLEGIRRAPKRPFTLSQQDTELALKNALRYIPERVSVQAGRKAHRQTDR